jgi:hypothetical protein
MKEIKEKPKSKSPKKETPRKTTPKKETPMRSTPKKETPMKSTPKKETPKNGASNTRRKRIVDDEDEEEIQVGKSILQIKIFTNFVLIVLRILIYVGKAKGSKISKEKGNTTDGYFEKFAHKPKKNTKPAPKKGGRIKKKKQSSDEDYRDEDAELDEKELEDCMEEESLDLEGVLEDSDATEKVEEPPKTRKRKLRDVDDEKEKIKNKKFDEVKKATPKKTPQKNFTKIPKKEEVFCFLNFLGKNGRRARF